MIKCPEGLSAHNFKPCDTHGGSAFRDWYMLMKHKGIFIGFHNHDWIVMASSEPKAEWVRGCQESAAYGDARPQSQTAKLIPLSDLPSKARALAEKWIDESIEIARQKIKNFETAECEKRVLGQRERDEEYRKTIVEPWLSCVQEEMEGEKQ